MVDCRRYFWGSVHGFSMYHEALDTPDGQRFLSECRNVNTPVCSWTLKRKERLGERIEKERMRQCARWGLQAYITDFPEMFRQVEEDVSNDQKVNLMSSLGIISNLLQSLLWRLTSYLG